MSEYKNIKIVQETAEENREELEKMGFKFEEPEVKLTDDEIFQFTIKRLNIDPNSTKYNYNETIELLRKYLVGILNIQDLILPQDIFNLFLIRFKTDILGEEIKIEF